MSNSSPDTRLKRLHDNVEYPLVGEVIIGRHSDCDIVVDDEGGVSRRHARLTSTNEGVYVSDLGSLNGTLVNGDEAAEHTELHNGDRLVFDENEYEVIIPAVEEAFGDEDVTRIANREEILARMALESKPAEISIDNEVQVQEVALNEVASNEVHPHEIDIADAQVVDAGEIEDSPPAPLLDSAPKVDDTAAEVVDVEELTSNISESDPFDRIRVDPSEADLAEPVSAEAAALEPEPEPVVVEPVVVEPVVVEPVVVEPVVVEPVVVEPVVAEPVVAEPVVPEPPAPAEPPVREAAAAERAAPPEPPPREEPKPSVSDEADLPGAWANTAAMMNSDNHTMIAQYVVPARNAPAEVDLSTVTVPALVIRTGDFEGKVLTLNAPATEWLVGSGAVSDLRIKQEGISSRHAVFVREQNKLKLLDELSVNGTFINGKRTNVGYIGHGDVLRFGPVECELFMPNFKQGLGGGRKSKAGAPAGASRKKKRGSKAWLKGLLIAAVLIPVIAIAILLLLPQ